MGQRSEYVPKAAGARATLEEAIRGVVRKNSENAYIVATLAPGFLQLSEYEPLNVKSLSNVIFSNASPTKCHNPGSWRENGQISRKIRGMLTMVHLPSTGQRRRNRKGVLFFGDETRVLNYQAQARSTMRNMCS